MYQGNKYMAQSLSNRTLADSRIIYWWVGGGGGGGGGGQEMADLMLSNQTADISFVNAQLIFFFCTFYCPKLFHTLLNMYHGNKYMAQ